MYNVYFDSLGMVSLKKQAHTFCLLSFASFLKEKPFSIRRDVFGAVSRNEGLAVCTTLMF